MKNIAPTFDMPYGRRRVRLKVPEIEGLVVGKTFEANSRFDILTPYGVLANIPGEWLEDVVSTPRKEHKRRHTTAQIVSLKAGKKDKPVSTVAQIVSKQSLKESA